MLVLRLSRFGKTKQPIYRIVVANKKAPVKGHYIEVVGNYNPRTKKIEIKNERIKHWLSLGVQPSDTVHNLLYNLKLVKEKIKKTVKPKKKEKKEEKREKPPVIEAPKRKEAEGSLAEEGIEEAIKKEEEKKEKAEKIMDAIQEQKTMASQPEDQESALQTKIETKSKTTDEKKGK